ncbi:protocatechuate 3,4-dioxygenase subunit alpha [Nocardioides panaciterrulae]|uniref:Protocatechuate 3,4-dioxygenase alpha subunit n=1 Tax=Nocardioides panaciterrulae TaxID=661492 RepID=A0A7Y9E9N3_9ACTN|nr:protocatechuate 3,4-dioxygenase subunit alpha [Nocardioides panaciterrulae]NYD43783.1 protocatechuate 3,4-dioxygenase alpha subunit [Nocardioides panaciterrulae]
MSRTPGDSAVSRAATPGQTVGPFYGFALPYAGDHLLVPASHPDAVRLHGRVLDGAGDPVPDALLELWQADPAGRVPRATGSLRRDGYTFTGWGRCATDNEGRFSFTTLRPGAASDGAAPYFALTVFARGLLNRLFTRAYLPGEPSVLDADPLLSSVAPARRGTLVTRPDEHGFAFDVRLQGADETVFLAYPRH